MIRRQSYYPTAMLLHSYGGYLIFRRIQKTKASIVCLHSVCESKVLTQHKLCNCIHVESMSVHAYMFSL